jgi:hypothetical protein
VFSYTHFGALSQKKEAVMVRTQKRHLLTGSEKTVEKLVHGLEEWSVHRKQDLCPGLIPLVQVTCESLELEHADGGFILVCKKKLLNFQEFCDTVDKCSIIKN